MLLVDLQQAVLLLGQGVMQLGSARGQRRVARRRVDRAGVSCNEISSLYAQEKEGKGEIAAKIESRRHYVLALSTSTTL